MTISDQSMISVPPQISHMEGFSPIYVPVEYQPTRDMLFHIFRDSYQYDGA